MFDTVKMIHGLVAYLFLILCIVSIVKALMNQKKEFSASQISLARFTFISGHIQLLLGIILWVLHDYAALFSDMGAVMKDATVRKMVVEHPLTNIIAIILVSIGFIQMKKASEDAAKHKKILIFFGIALILVLSMIPRFPWMIN